MLVRVRRQTANSGRPRYRYETKVKEKWTNVTFDKIEKSKKLEFYFTPSMGKSDRNKVRKLWEHKLIKPEINGVEVKAEHLESVEPAPVVETVKEDISTPEELPVPDTFPGIARPMNPPVDLPNIGVVYGD